MKVGTYIETVLKRWWLIALCLLLAFASSWFYSGLQVPVHTATVTMAINPSAPTQLFPYLSGSTAGVFSFRDPLVALATGYQEYLHSRRFTSLAIKHLNLPMDPEMLGALVSTSLVKDTNFLRVNATWVHPVEAQRIANGIVNLMLEQLDEKESTGPRAEIQKLVDYYRPKVEALRRERDRTENDPTLSPREKIQVLGAIDTRLTAMEELVLKLRASLGESAGDMALLGGRGVGLQPAGKAIEVIDWARIPSEPEGTGARRNLLMAVLAGLIMGVGLAFVLEYIDERVRSPRQLEQALGVAPLAVVGEIPDLGKKLKGRNVGNGAVPQHNGFSPRLVAALDPLHPAAEDFRLARTMILGRGLAGACQCLLVTSARPGEGKSITLANLAVAMAQGGKKVVVVDADLRRPALHRLFSVSNEAGLSAVLAGEGDVGRWLQSTPIDNLRILTAGLPKSSPADVLSSPLLVEALQELRGCTEVVLIDGPALSVAADALVIAHKVDGVLLVAEAARTTSTALLEARSSLERVGANMLGVILTRFSEKKDGAYYRSSKRPGAPTPRLGEYMIKSNFLTADQLRTALKRQGEWGAGGKHKRIGEVLVELGYVTQEELEKASSRQQNHSEEKGAI